jgi:hypothetical protein
MDYENCFYLFEKNYKYNTNKIEKGKFCITQEFQLIILGDWFNCINNSIMMATLLKKMLKNQFNYLILGYIL